jgi:hypothetical protein
MAGPSFGSASSVAQDSGLDPVLGQFIDEMARAAARRAARRAAGTPDRVGRDDIPPQGATNG